MNSSSIRTRIKSLGWQLNELPIRSGNSIRQWKIIAVKNDKSFQITGQTLDEAIKNIGMTLGVIPNERKK